MRPLAVMRDVSVSLTRAHSASSTCASTSTPEFSAFSQLAPTALLLVRATVIRVLHSSTTEGDSQLVRWHPESGVGRRWTCGVRTRRRGNRRRCIEEQGEDRDYDDTTQAR